LIAGSRNVSVLDTLFSSFVLDLGLELQSLGCGLGLRPISPGPRLSLETSSPDFKPDSHACPTTCSHINDPFSAASIFNKILY